MGFELDTSSMREALRLYAEVSTRAFPDIVNKKMKDVIIKTRWATPAVSRNQISEELRAAYVNISEAYVRTGARKGQLKKYPKVRYKVMPLARAIIIARLRKQGLDPRSLGKGEIDKKTEAMIGSRLSSGSYALSGWGPAAKLFGANSSFGSVPQFTVQGSGTLATTDQAVAEIRNDTLVKWNSGSTGYREVTQALQDAMDDVAEETLEYASKVLEDLWGKIERR